MSTRTATPAGDAPPSGWRRWLPPLVVAAAGAAAYAGVLRAGFVWDDGPIIVDNPATRDLAGMWRLLLSPDVVVPYYRPVNRLSYLLDFALFGMSPAGFHAVNVALHLVNALLVRRLGLILFERREAPSVIAALLFAVHPVNAEAVDFVSARNNLLALLFLLLAAFPLLRGAPERLRLRGWLSGSLWFLALLSKESAAAAVLLFLAFAVWGPWTAGTSRRERLLALVPHALFAGAYLVLRRLALGGVVGKGLALGHLVQALRVNIEVVPRYLELILFPARLNLLHEVPGTGSSAWPWLVAGWLLLGLLLALLLRRPTVPSTVGLLWIAVNFAPISNVVPIPSAAMAERYLYLPAVGVWIIAADRLAGAWGSGRWRRLAAAAAAAVLLLLGARTARRSADWGDEVALFGSIVRVDPRSATGYYNLGCALRERGDLAAARREWEKAVQVDPGHAGAFTQLGTAAAVEGDMVRAERFYRMALAARDPGPTVHLNLARVYERTGRTREAIESYDRFLREAGPEDARDVATALTRRAALRAVPESGPR